MVVKETCCKNKNYFEKFLYIPIIEYRKILYCTRYSTSYFTLAGNFT